MNKLLQLQTCMAENITIIISTMHIKAVLIATCKEIAMEISYQLLKLILYSNTAIVVYMLDWKLKMIVQ